MTDEEESGATYNLLMPFVVVKSNGGIYEDDAFTAGWGLGMLYQELATIKDLGALPRPRYGRVDHAPQVDLIAMKNGFTVSTSKEFDGWILYTFERGTDA